MARSPHPKGTSASAGQVVTVDGGMTANHLLMQFVADVLVHDEPAARNAALSAIVIDAVGNAIGGSLDVGVGKHDLRGLAALLLHAFDVVARGLLLDECADLG